MIWTDAERNVPGSWKTMPSGSSVMPQRPPAAVSAPSRMRAAPVRTGKSVGCGWVRPSGKISRTPPPRSTPMAAANIASFFFGSSPASTRRLTGTACIIRRNGPMSGWRKSGALASTITGRWNSITTCMASTIELWWLATASTGPVAGMRSRPTTSIRR